MNSLELPAPFQLSADTSHWDEVRRIFRRVCVLHAQGRNDEASLLENRDLARALTTARAVAESDHEEAAVLATEKERVLTASITAELLAPLLAERLSSALTSPVSHVIGSPSLAQADAAPREPRPPASSQPQPAVSTRASGVVPSITDLIDGMLSQES